MSDEWMPYREMTFWKEMEKATAKRRLQEGGMKKNECYFMDFVALIPGDVFMTRRYGPELLMAIEPTLIHREGKDEYVRAVSLETGRLISCNDYERVEYYPNAKVGL